MILNIFGYFCMIILYVTDDPTWELIHNHLHIYLVWYLHLVDPFGIIFKQIVHRSGSFLYNFIIFLNFSLFIYLCQ